MRTLFRATLPYLAAALAACATTTAGSDTDPTGAARLTVENRSSLDMDLYAVQDRRETRLGFLAAGETAAFPLPPGLISGGGSLQFEARPARRSGSTVPSELYLVRAGDDIAWSIPPQ